MAQKYRSSFNPRQYMNARDFEVFYYSDTHFQSVGSHSHDYYEFYFFAEGSVEMELSGKRCPVAKGDLVVVPPGLAHRAVILDPEVPYRRFVFWISPGYYDGLIEQSACFGYLRSQVLERKAYVYHFDAVGFNAIRSKLFTLLDELHADRFGRDARIMLCLNDVMLYLNRSVYEQQHPRGHRESLSLYNAISEFIASHLEEELTLDRLAREFYVSKYYISHLFQETTGLSVHQSVTKQRLNACCDAIRSGAGITAAYEAFGFRDYSSFYRAFRKEYGVSPAEYRALHENDAPANPLTKL